MKEFFPKSQISNMALSWIFFGVGGVGKTRTGLKLYGPEKTFLINLELGSRDIESVGIGREDLNEKGEKVLSSLDDIYSLIEWLSTQKYRAVFIDSLTVLYGYIFAKVNNKKFEYNSDGGWDNKNKAVEESERFCKFLQEKLQSKGIDVILAAHDKMAVYNNPQEDKPYDRFLIDSPYDPISKVFVRFADNVGFCHFVESKRADAGKKIKMDGDGSRNILFENRPWAPDCKNRCNLPAIVVMDKEAISLQAALIAGEKNKDKSPKEVREEINNLLKAVPFETRRMSMIAIDKAGDDLHELCRIKDKLSILMGAQ